MRKPIVFTLFVLATCHVKAQSEVVIAGDHICLRSTPNERSKITGPYNPHFNTGDRLPCVGSVGDYYKVIFNSSYYYIPQVYARPHGDIHRNVRPRVSKRSRSRFSRRSRSRVFRR